MSTKTIKVFVEKAADGTYWGTTQNLEGVASSFGNTLEELKSNLSDAVQDQVDLAVELGQDWVVDYLLGYDFEFKLDLQGFFNLISEVKISNLAEKAKMNPSLVRQYKTGKAVASEEQLHKLERAVHELGKELSSVSF